MQAPTDIEMQDRSDREAQETEAGAVGRAVGTEVAWLILRHFVAEFPGLASLKQPFEKCQELSEKAKDLKDEAEGLRRLCMDMESALREGNEDHKQATEKLIQELTNLSAKEDVIIDMTSVDRLIHYDKLKKSYDESVVTFKILERQYHDYKLDCVKREMQKELRSLKEELQAEMHRNLLAMQGMFRASLPEH